MSKSKNSNTPSQIQYVLDQLPFRVFWKDKESRYLGCNQAFSEDTGFNDPSLVIGKTDFDLPWTSNAKQLHAHDAAVISTGVPFESYQEPIGDLLGLKFWLHLKKIPLRNNVGATIGIIGMYEDISELKKIQFKDIKIQRALDLLINANRAVALAQNENSFFSNICHLAVEAGYIMAWVGLANSDEQQSISPVAQAGVGNGYLTNIKISWGNNKYGNGPTGIAIREIRTVVNQNFLTNPAMLSWREAAIKIGYQASIALPISYPEIGVIGALSIYATEANAFSADEVSLLEELAKIMALGIAGVRDRKNRYETLISTVAAIAAIVELRDPYTAGHQRRVANLAVAIASEIGLEADQIEGIRLAGLIHDVGKIGVPAEILSKPTKLSTAEYMIIKTHPEVGYEVLKDIPFQWPIAEMVRQHHERMDGSGYPKGLDDGIINLGARIIAVADLIEAMSSHRPYRAALGIDAALHEIERGKSKLYDSKVVDACVKLFKQNHYEFPAI